MTTYDPNYLKIGQFERQCMARLDSLPDFAAAITGDLQPILDQVPTQTRLPNEALAILIAATYRLGQDLADLPSFEIAAIVRLALTLMAGLPVPDFGTHSLVCHAWDGRDWAHFVAERGTLH